MKKSQSACGRPAAERLSILSLKGEGFWRSSAKNSSGLIRAARAQRRQRHDDYQKAPEQIAASLAHQDTDQRARDLAVEHDRGGGHHEQGGGKDQRRAVMPRQPREADQR